MSGLPDGGTLRVGVDVGGTFTDFVLLDPGSGAVHHHKIASTPDDPARAIVAGLGELLARAGAEASRVGWVGHGTTVATNMVIERRGARTGLVTTRGFRDVLEIARQTRPHLYDYTRRRPPPLVRRALRLEVAERLDAGGAVISPLSDEDVARAVERLRAAGVESVAVALLHAYRNPAHERRVAAAVAAAMPHAYVSLSSEVLPEFREFERTSTTVLNAYVGPRMRSYVERLRGGLRGAGVTVEPYTMQSSGGVMSVDDVRRFPVRTCLSGPAAGVVGAGVLGREADRPDLVTFDVGGTSTDVSLVHEGSPAFTAERDVAGHPVRAPMIDVHVIGAGGGSIAYIDDAGALKVGPRSAGADPGPVAYGRGGEHVTLTDANVVLGRLSPAALLGGRMAVDAGAARAAVETQIARPLGIGCEAAALGIVEVAVASIARAIRAVSTERGHDPGAFTLLAYGGAGPVHASAVAREVDCPSVMIPLEPGTLCARGMLLSDVHTDFLRTEVAALDAPTWARVRAHYRALADEAEAWFAREGAPTSGRRLEPLVEARYAGQGFEVPVAFATVEDDDVDAFARAFHAAHRAVYGYDIPGRAIVVVNCRLRAIVSVSRPAAPGDAAPAGPAAPVGRRPVLFDLDTGMVDCPVYARAALAPGTGIAGPAVVEEMSSTTLVAPGDVCTVDSRRNLLVRVGTGGR